jgi:hypothetical protein
MPVRTSAIFYGRGVPKKSTNNFAFVAQTNNTVISPISKYVKSYNFFNRNYINTNVRRGLLFNNN